MNSELLAGYSSYTGIEHVLEEDSVASMAHPQTGSVTFDPTNTYTYTWTYSSTA